MGLDQYAMCCDPKLADKAVDFKVPSEAVQEVHYWRKHPNLHGWMEHLYRKKGGADENFNCSTLLLTLEDLDNLEKAIKGKDLPHTEGFFFGFSIVDERVEDDLEFIKKARQAIEEGKVVFYDSWW
jgi:hypothetical protein